MIVVKNESFIGECPSNKICILHPQTNMDIQWQNTGGVLMMEVFKRDTCQTLSKILAISRTTTNDPP